MQIECSPLAIYAINNLTMRISDSGYVVTDDHWRSSNVCSPYSRLYLVTAGSGELETDGVVIPMTAGHAYLVPAGLTFGYRSPTGLEKLYFHVTLQQPNGFELLTSVKRILQVEMDVAQMQAMRALYRTPDWTRAFLLDGAVRGAIAALLRSGALPDLPVAQYSEPVTRAIAYIRAHLSMQLSESSIAAQLFLSESQLARRFREEVGCTISRYIDDLIYFEAELQLAADTHTIGEISESLGFCDQFYFSRRFRQRHGVTPREYRARLRAETYGG